MRFGCSFRIWRWNAGKLLSTAAFVTHQIMGICLYTKIYVCIVYAGRRERVCHVPWTYSFQFPFRNVNPIGIGGPNDNDNDDSYKFPLSPALRY